MSWRESLDRVSWILRDGFDDILIARAEDLQVLSAGEAAAAFRSGSASGGDVRADSGWGASTTRDRLLHADPWSGSRWPSNSGFSPAEIEAGVARGGLIALKVRSSPRITAGEIATFEALRQRQSVPAPPPPVRPPKPETPLHQYRVRVLDDTGAPVCGARVKFEIEATPRMQVTDSRGMATVEWFSTAPASVHLLDLPQLRQQLARQWEEPISDTLPTDADVHSTALREGTPPLKLPVDTLSTIVLCRDAKHRFEVVVYDPFGQVLDGVDLRLTVDGADQTLTTDSVGRAVYEGASDSTAKLRVADIDRVRDKLVARAMSAGPTRREEKAQKAQRTIADAIPVVVGKDTPVVSLEAEAPTKIVLRRKVVRVRLVGMFFDHAKCFLLPSALDGIRRINEIYREHPDANLLAVGHTDTRHLQDSADDGTKFNKKLSLDRAKSVAAYLTNDVASWYAWYDVDGERGWGTPEDVQMLANVPPGEDPYYHEGDNYRAAVKNYQANNGVPTTGTVAERTRRVLIADYMSAKGTTLPEGVTLTCHGCGPYFPDIPSGPNDNVPQNRRVEIFVFDGPILPPPPGDFSEPGSPEYEAWVAQVGETIDFSTSEPERRPFRITVDTVDQSPWKEDDLLVASGSQGAVVWQSRIGDGQPVGPRRMFQFRDYVQGERYRMEIRFAGQRFVLLDAIDVHSAVTGSGDTHPASFANALLVSPENGPQPMENA